VSATGRETSLTAVTCVVRANAIGKNSQPHRRVRHHPDALIGIGLATPSCDGRPSTAMPRLVARQYPAVAAAPVRARARSPRLCQTSSRIRVTNRRGTVRPESAKHGSGTCSSRPRRISAPSCADQLCAESRLPSVANETPELDEDQISGTVGRALALLPAQAGVCRSSASRLGNRSERLRLDRSQTARRLTLRDVAGQVRRG
jgi:hypothetical protein